MRAGRTRCPRKLPWTRLWTSLFSVRVLRFVNRCEVGPLLDNPEKTTKLLPALKAAAPFEVELTEWLVKELRRQHDAVADSSLHTVSDLSYAGDEGGIVCHVVPP